MTRATPDPDRAFRALARRLAAARARELGVRLWVVLGVLALAIAAFTYWQVRVPLDGTLRSGGSPAAIARLAVILVAFAAAGAVIAWVRQTAIVAAPPGPEWLSLPLSPASVERHLSREASAPARVVAVPAAAAWLTGWGLLPAGWLALLALGFALLLELLLRAACAAALRTAAGATSPARALPAAWRALVTARRPAPPARMAAARFRAESRWRALARLDRAVSARAGSPRARLTLAAAFLALSVAAWFLSPDLVLARAQAFAAFTLACAELGAWAAWRAAGDPASALRPLPLSLGDAWRARAFPLAAAIAVVLLIHALAPQGVAASARVGLALSWLLPAALLVLLGLHVGLSLAGRPGTAENLYYGWLGAGLVGSLAIPLFGWAVVISGLVQSTRRLTRWRTPEVV
jgi:hypothetical protein